MPQWRKLHTKITESLDVNDMPDDFTRLLWVLLPTQLCREGRGVDNPSWVRSRVFPMREDVTLQMVTAALDWYERRGMIVRYQVEDRGYFYVPTFHRYQGNTAKEAASEYPAPPEQDVADSGPTPELVQSRSSTDSDADSDSESTLAATSAAAPVRVRKPSIAQQRLGAMEEHFAKRSGLPKPLRDTTSQKKAGSTLWWQPLKEILRLCDNDVGRANRVIDDALALHRDKQWAVNDPKSIIRSARTIASQQAARASPTDSAPVGWSSALTGERNNGNGKQTSG